LYVSCEEEVMLAVGVVVGVLFIAGSIFFIMIYIRYVLLSSWSFEMGGSVAEWLACWTQVQYGPGSNRSRDAVG